jgi:nitrate reductase NapE
MRNEPERHGSAGNATSADRTTELRSFLFLTIVMIPVLAVVIVGGYGFFVWMYQIVAGPPSG